MHPLRLFFLLIIFTTKTSCTQGSGNQNKNVDSPPPEPKVLVRNPYDTTITTIHILVALCDNENQGIVPVPAAIGNGQDPAKNLYWGAKYGIKNHFKLSKEWTLVESRSQNQNDKILERCIFKHRTKNDVYLIADAYDGIYIKDATVDFINSLTGHTVDTLHIGSDIIGTNANAKLISYIGHNGLMDFEISEKYTSIDNKERDCIILACMSKKYFEPYVSQSGANPLLWTTNFMAPEAYTIHDAISAYLAAASSLEVHQKAANAYARYQKCSIAAAKKLIVTGY